MDVGMCALTYLRSPPLLIRVLRQKYIDQVELSKRIGHVDSFGEEINARSVRAPVAALPQTPRRIGHLPCVRSACNTVCACDEYCAAHLRNDALM
jgi:hypothetical protein